MNFKTLLIILTLLLCSFSQIFGQEKFSVTAGFGFLELLNVGARFNGAQSEFALSIGTFPRKEESTMSVSGDFYFHFGGHAKLVERKPWFAKMGVNYFKADSQFLIERYFYLNLGMGREFNISKKLGMQLSIGTIFQLDQNITVKPPLFWDDYDSDPILPALSFVTFYKL